MARKTRSHVKEIHPFSIKRIVDDEGNHWYHLINSKLIVIGEVHKVELGTEIQWVGVGELEDKAKNHFQISLHGPSLRVTADALYKAMKAIAFGGKI